MRPGLKCAGWGISTQARRTHKTSQISGSPLQLQPRNVHLKPDFIVIGAQRCGTTALYAALRQHPQVFMPSPKEPRFFAFVNQPPAFVGPGAERFRQETVVEGTVYQALFAPAAPVQRCGEASPVYLSAAQSSASAVAMHQLTVEMIFARCKFSS